MKAKAIAKRINMGGARPRPGVDRYPCGQIKHDQRKPRETEEEAMATVIAQRLKAGIPEDLVRAQAAETPFGRLFLAKIITGIQYEAGKRYARTTARYHDLMGIPRPWPRAIDLDGGGGRTNRPEPEPDQVDQIKRDYADMRRVILDLEMSATYRGTTKALYDVILLEKDVERDVAALGNLRSGLNVMARMWGMMPA